MGKCLLPCQEPKPSYNYSTAFWRFSLLFDHFGDGLQISEVGMPPSPLSADFW